MHPFFGQSHNSAADFGNRTSKGEWKQMGANRRVIVQDKIGHNSDFKVIDRPFVETETAQINKIY